MLKSSEILPCPGVPLVKTRGQGTRRYQIRLITPMFGGGVSPRVNDVSFPVRPTAIRGQLQFWWRATVGAWFATPDELRAAESAVWGDTTRASRVQVRVADVQAESHSRVLSLRETTIAATHFVRRPPGTHRLGTPLFLSLCTVPFSGTVGTRSERD